MARREDTTPGEVTTRRISWIRSQAIRLGNDLAGARDSKSWSAVAALQREIRTLRDALDTELLRRAEARAAELKAAPTTCTPEEWRARVLADADACSDDDLDIYGAEWLSRHGYIAVVEAGELSVRRRAG